MSDVFSDGKPKPPYSEFPCSEAPLRPASAPEEGCVCRVCKWLRENGKQERGKAGAARV